MGWPALLLSFGSLFAMACGSPTSSSDKGVEAELAPGEARDVGGLHVAFDRIVGDSRCPVDVACVWQGDGVAQVALSQGGQSPQTFELHTAKAKPVSYAGYDVELVRLRPEAHSTEPIAPESYRLTVRVSPTN